jgi:hypothetical protein
VGLFPKTINQTGFIYSDGGSVLMVQEGERLIRGVFEEAAVITTAEGSYRRLTIREPRAVDEETGMIIKTLRSLLFSQVYRNGEPLSESALLSLRGNRIEIHFLPENIAEIRLVR